MPKIANWSASDDSGRSSSHTWHVQTVAQPEITTYPIASAPANPAKTWGCENLCLKFPITPAFLARVVFALLCWFMLGASRAATADGGALHGHRHRVLVSTDIGGTDPDD